jgi:RHS repeat-associated protein
MVVAFIAANTASYAYVVNSSLIDTVTLKNAGTTRLTAARVYDHLNRLASITSTPSAAAASSHAYDYNAANQRTKATRENSDHWNYGYDALGQVTSGQKYDSANVGLPGHDFAWTYDDIGNRKTATVNGQAATYTPTSLNQYSQRTVPAVVEVLGAAAASATVTVSLNSGTPQATTRHSELFFKPVAVNNATAAQTAAITVTGVKNNVGSGGEDAVTQTTKTAFLAQTPEAFTADSDGNLTADARWAYTWDGENRLSAMETSPAAATAGVAKLKLEFSYDGQGRRVSKKVSNWTGSAWTLASQTLFLYDGWNMVAELNALSSNAAVRTYVWGLDGSGSFQGAGGVGGLIGVTDSTGSRCATYDGNGNVSGLVDLATGTRSATYEYSAFGETLISDGAAALTNPFRFSTKYTDDETGLLYYGLRYYQPTTGRWLGRDPIGENGGINLYGYVGGNPINRLDLLGLCNCDTLRRKLHILLRASSELHADLNGQIANEMAGEYLSVRNMVAIEGLEAGSAAVTAYEAGAGMIAKRVAPWLRLGGTAMSDYAVVSNRGLVREGVRAAMVEAFGSQVVDPLAKAATLGTAAYVSENFGDALEYGQGTMAVARQMTDRLQFSYNGLLKQIKKLQQEYRENCQ